MNLQRAPQLIFFGLLLFMVSVAMAEHTQSDSGSSAQKAYQPIKLTREERVWLQHNPNIRMTGVSNQEPFLIQGEDGSIDGIAADLFNQIYRVIGQSIDISLYKLTEADARASNPGNYGNSVKIRTPETVKQYLLTEPYFYTPFYLFTTKEKLSSIEQASDLRGKRVAVIEGHNAQLSYLNSIGGVEVVEAQSPIEQMKLVSSGAVDAMMGYITYHYLINKHLFSSIHMAFVGKGSVGIRIGVNPEYPLLHTILDKAIATISDRQRGEVLAKWTRLSQQEEISRIELTEVEQRWLEKNPSFNVAAFPLAPYIMQKEGELTGYMPELLQLISSKVKLTPQFSYHEISNEAFTAVQTGKVEASMGMINTPERAQHVTFSPEAMPLNMAIFARKGSDSIGNLESLKNKRIASYHGYAIATLTKEQLPDAQLVMADDAVGMLQLVATGKADAAIQELHTGNYMLSKYYINNLEAKGFAMFKGFEIPDGHSYVVNREFPVLHSILEKGYLALTDSEKQTLWNKWFGKSELIGIPEIRLTVEERAWLAENPVIRLGNSVDWQPISFVNKNGLYSGISSDYLSYIGEQLGVRFEPSMLDSWKETVEKAFTGELDMLGSAVPTPQREKHLTFTRPYLSYPLVIFTRMDVSFIADMSELNGQRVAVNEGSATHDILQNNHPEFDLYPVKNTRHGLMAVAEGKASAFISELVTSSHVMADEGLTNLKISGEAPYRYDISMAIHKSQPLLASILQKALNAIPEEEHNEIYRKWLSITFEHKSDYTPLIKLLVLVILVLVTALLWIRHTQVKRLTAEIESRKSAEAALKESEEQFRSVIEKLPVPMVIVDHKGNSEYINSKFIELFGWTVDEIYTPEKWWSCAYPDPEYRKIVQDGWERAVAEAVAADEEIKPQEWMLTCKSGEQRDVIFRMVPVNDKRSAIALDDVTERNRDKKTLQDQNVLFNAVLESPSDIIIFVVDDKYNYLTFNGNHKEAMQAVYGVEIELGMNMLEVMNTDELRSGLKGYCDRALSGESFTEVGEQTGLDMFFELSWSPLLTESGEIVGATSFTWEVTDRVKAERALHKAHDELDERVRERTQELSAANESLQHAKESAESANRTKSIFLSKMSHELRTPMNAILGYAQILYNDVQLTEKQRSRLKIILESGDHLLSLISDILDLARIEANRIELGIAPLAIRPFINKIVDVVRYSAKGKNISLVCDIDQLAPPAIMADERHLRQILLNLLGNAIKFTPEGVVTLKVALCKNDKDATKYCCLRFSVEDTGVGIPEESQQEIFNSFVQLMSDGFGAEGTGLGLTISHQLVEMMGGELKLTSQVGRGSRFWFDLELPVLEGGEESTIRATSLPKGYRGEKHKIMVVDDIEHNRNMLRDLLEGVGFVVIEAADGAESVELAQTEIPDLIMMDLVMPQMDGYQAVAALRLLPDLERIPVVAVSASITEEEKALASGFNRFIPKPVEFGLLKTVLDELLLPEWIGEGAHRADEINAQSNEDEIPKAPSAEQLNELRRLIELGKMLRIIEWASTLEAGFPEYEAFARRVRMLAEQVDGEGIMDMLAQYP